jgi:hypothetical protein
MINELKAKLQKNKIVLAIVVAVIMGLGVYFYDVNTAVDVIRDLVEEVEVGDVEVEEVTSTGTSQLSEIERAEGSPLNTLGIETAPNTVTDDTVSTVD